MNIIGQRFNKLVVQSVRRSESGKIIARCRCDCGIEKDVWAYNLWAPKPTKSCGCWRKVVSSSKGKTHGMSGTKEYRSWGGIKKRCTNPRCKNWKDYGGRGITMCNRWMHSFENFYADMGGAPSKHHSIERDDVLGNYEPSNCRWILRPEQQWNKNNTVYTTDGSCYGEVIGAHHLSPTKAAILYNYLVSSEQMIDYCLNSPFSVPSLVDWFKQHRGVDIQLRVVK